MTEVEAPNESTTIDLSIVCPVKFIDSIGNRFRVKMQNLGIRAIYSSPYYLALRKSTIAECQSLKLHNRLPGNHTITSKKYLYYNMTEYYKQKGKNPNKYLPVTFHFDHSNSDEIFDQLR